MMISIRDVTSFNNHHLRKCRNVSFSGTSNPFYLLHSCYDEDFSLYWRTFTYKEDCLNMQKDLRDFYNDGFESCIRGKADYEQDYNNLRIISIRNRRTRTLKSLVETISCLRRNIT